MITITATQPPATMAATKAFVPAMIVFIADIVVLIAPITSKVNSKPKLKTHVYLEKDKKITHDSIVLMEQIRVLDKSRLGSFLCSLNKEKLQEIDKALICSFQIDIASYIDNLIKKEEKR